MTQVRIARIYESASSEDGYRMLVDRLWPRGVSKTDAALDEWCKDLAPSQNLRTWWSHDPESFDEFTERYRAELDENELLSTIMERLETQPRITLLYAAKDPAVNHALVLRDYLREHFGGGSSDPGISDPGIQADGNAADGG
ncbi:DUF488 domain-containing protein [Salinibacterium sp. M195]|uniref:DUF488 domain-containing protein n=1 Tax=Salinibacterium sp. M195 TaxID=2583374 RepID=UPI00351D24A3|nr:DUF488 domain-containing protein [Salinibacterium sp. M195]